MWFMFPQQPLKYKDFVVTSLNPEIVSYENGLFTVIGNGNTEICVEYMGCATYITVEVLGDRYYIPMSMYSAGTGSNGSGKFEDYREYEGDMITYVEQHPLNGWLAIEITGDNWTQLKKIAEDGGYTKIVLKIVGEAVLGATDANYFPALTVGVNDFSKFASQEKLVILVAAADWTVSTNRFNFSLYFEK